MRAHASEVHTFTPPTDNYFQSARLLLLGLHLLLYLLKPLGEIIAPLWSEGRVQSIGIMQIQKYLHLSDDRVQFHSPRHGNISSAKISEPPRSYTGDGATRRSFCMGNTVAPFAGASEVHVCMQLHLASGYGTRLWRGNL